MDDLANAVRGEFIGEEMKVVSPGLASPVRGRVIDETRNTFRLRRGEAQTLVCKKGSRIFLRRKESTLEIPGDVLIGNPEDRIKKKIRSRMR